MMERSEFTQASVAIILACSLLVAAKPSWAERDSWDDSQWDRFIWRAEPGIDSDGDGTRDVDDAFPLDSAEWWDTDGDGTGNNVDGDDDNDGLLDSTEASLGTNSFLADTDGDGVDDGDETAGGSDPLDPESFPVPEPAPGWLAVAALLTLLGLRRRQQRLLCLHPPEPLTQS